jgi:hypothetical protein
VGFGQCSGPVEEEEKSGAFETAGDETQDPNPEVSCSLQYLPYAASKPLELRHGERVYVLVFERALAIVLVLDMLVFPFRRLSALLYRVYPVS